MSSIGWLARRLAFAVLAVYVVISISFLFVALTPDPHTAAIAHGMANNGATAEEITEAVTAYRASRNLDDPLIERYLRWVVDITTLDWGVSYDMHRPVVSLLAQRLPYTLLYALPGMIIAMVGGISMGLYSSLYRGRLLNSVGNAFASIGMGVPNFWLAEVGLFVFAIHLGWIPESMGTEHIPTGLHQAGAGVLHTETLTFAILPAAILGFNLLAGQLRYTRAETSEYVNTEFVKLLRAKGASESRVARHVLRNASLPLISLFFADMIGVLLIHIYVLETVFGIPGIGDLSYLAINNHDMPLVLGTTMVLVFFGVLGNLLQDVAAFVLDPRLENDG